MFDINNAVTLSAAIGEELALSDIFYTNNKKGNAFQVKLTSKGFCLRREFSGVTKEQIVALCDIVGGRCMRSDTHRRNLSKTCTCGSSSVSKHEKITPKCIEDEKYIDSSAYLYVFAYVLKKNLRSTLRRERTVLTLRFRSFDKFEDNIREAEKWLRVLQWHRRAVSLNESNYEFKINNRLLILLNPKSGSGKAREFFHEQVVPVLNEAEVMYDLYVTKHANFARDFVRVKNITAWDGIVAVGGDGLFFEVLNGLLQRTDWINVVTKIPMGIVPCGSGNGLARTIAHLYREPYEPKPILGAALTIISGKTAPMDVVRIEMNNEVLFSFLSVGWGLISDIDIESERLRSLGYQRFTLWSLHRLISLRKHRGKISYILKQDNVDNVIKKESEKHENLPHSTSCNTYLKRTEYFQSADFINCNEFEDIISLETTVNQTFRSRCDSWFSVGSRKSTFFSIPESIYHSISGESFENEHINESGKQFFGPTPEIPSLSEPLPDTWIVEEGDFIMVHAAYQTHLGADCFFAPASKLNDGIIYLIIIRGGTSRSQLFNFLVNMSSGTHLPTKENSLIKVVQVTAFRIEPYDTNGIITVDGERVEYGALQGQIIQGLAKVMVPK